MKIGIDARLYFESGVGRYIKNTLRELDDYCSSNKTENKFYIFLSKKGFEEVNFESNSIVRIEADIPWHSLREQASFSRLINSYDLDVMHFTYFSLPLLYRRKFVVTIHDLILNYVDTGKATTLPKYLYRLKRFFYFKVIRHAVKNSCYIISPSESTKKEIAALYKVSQDKIIVIPEGVDPVFLKKPVKPRARVPNRYMLYVGNAYPHKNLERLIEAFARINEKIPQDLILVGKSDYFYKRLIRRVSKMTNIHIYNNINDENLSYLYSNADFLVAPSFMEGFGLTPLEAMAHNCLPVVSGIDAFYEVCENAALYFNPEDIQDIASILYKAANMTDEGKKIYEKLFKERIAKFSWEKSLKKTLDTYERCNSI